MTAVTKRIKIQTAQRREGESPSPRRDRRFHTTDFRSLPFDLKQQRTGSDFRSLAGGRVSTRKTSEVSHSQAGSQHSVRDFGSRVDWPRALAYASGYWLLGSRTTRCSC